MKRVLLLCSLLALVLAGAASAHRDPGACCPAGEAGKALQAHGHHQMNGTAHTAGGCCQKTAGAEAKGCCEKAEGAEAKGCCQKTEGVETRGCCEKHGTEAGAKGGCCEKHADAGHAEAGPAGGGCCQARKADGAGSKGCCQTQARGNGKSCCAKTGAAS